MLMIIKSQMAKNFNTTTKVTVRFSDTDAMGHCNNARLFSYMEEGRVHYFHKLYPEYKPSSQFELFPFILADIQCSFKSPAYCGEILIVALGVTEIGNKSFVIEYNITEEKTNRLIALGKSVLVMFDYKTHKTYPVPQDLLERIKNIEQK